MKLHHFRTDLIVAFVLATTPVMSLGQDDEDFRTLELETTLEVAQRQNDQLERENRILKEANRVLAESLGASNEEADELRSSYQEALLRLELLGAETVNTEGEGLQERLKQIAQEFLFVSEEKENLGKALMNLSTEVMMYMKSAVSSDAEARLAVEKAIRQGDEAMGLAGKEEQLEVRTIDDAKVITYQGDYNLLVLNVGREQGLRNGMPLKVLRKDRLIATALVVEVRDMIAGAVIKELNEPGDVIRVGDTIQVDPEGA